MTVTSPASGAPVPRHRSTRRLLATGAALLLVLGFATPAAADTVTPSPSPSATALSGEAEVSVAPAANGVVRAGQPLTVTTTLRNGLPRTLNESRVVLALGAQPLADRSALDAWLAGEGGDDAAQDVAESTLPLTASGEEATATISLPAEDPALAGRAPGAYPLRITATIGDEQVSTRSVVTVVADGATAPVGVVVPITAGARASGLLTVDELTAMTAPDGALTAQLAAVEGTSAILAVDPAIPAAIRVLGTSAPASAIEWVERLETMPNSRFALQFGDADLAAQLQSGLAAPLSPTSLVAYMDAADFRSAPAPDASPSPSPTASPSPTVTTAPDAPALPDLVALTDVGPTARPAVYWPATGSAGSDVVTSLGGLSATDTPAITLVSSGSTAAGASGATVPAAASVGSSAALVYDAGISELLTEAADAEVDDERAAALAAATAELSFATAAAGGRPLLVAIDRGTARDRSALRSAITAATLAPNTTVLTLDQLATTPAEAVEVGSVEPDAARSAELTLLMGDEAAISTFSSILDDPQLLTGPQRAEILQLLGVAWRGDADAAAAAVGTHRETTAETLDSVGILSTGVTLLSYGAAWRPYVRNDLPFPVNVTLVAEPDSAALKVQARTEVPAAQPNSNTRVEIPVEARVGNSDVTVAMQLLSPTGERIGSPASASIEVHAEWETIGLVILGAIMVIFLAGGVVRTVLRRRARAAEAAETEAGE